MTDLVQTLLSSFDANSVKAISQQLGMSPQNTGNAIQAALPLLLGQMGRNAAQPEGANALFGAIQRDHAGVNLGGLLGSVLGAVGGGQAQPAAPNLAGGMAILSHVFGGGGTQRAAAPQVPTVPGLDGANSARLLAMLAPLVMGALGRMTQGGQVSANSLSSLLGSESQRVAQAPNSMLGGLMSAVLDRDGDGQVGLGEIAQGLGSLFGNK